MYCFNCMVDLIIDKRDNLGFIPEIIGYLASIKEFEYSYKYYNLRHPGAIFNVATNYVVRDFIGLLDELEEYRTHYKKYDYHRDHYDIYGYGLEAKFRILIYDLIKFYDSCAEIIIGCCKQHSPRPTIFLWKWLETNGYKKSSKYMFKNTKNELSSFRNINNKLKHSSSKIISNNLIYRDTIVMGFFVEAAFDDGSVGPDEIIHPKYKGKHSAISYNFILRNMYYTFYKISEVLKEAIIQHLKDVYQVSIHFNRAYNKSNDKLWRELYIKMKNLPAVYFPNEIGNEVYKFEELRDKLVFTKIHAKSINVDWIKWDFRQSGDGFTRTYRIPFMGLE